MCWMMTASPGSETKGGLLPLLLQLMLMCVCAPACMCSCAFCVRRREVNQRNVYIDHHRPLSRMCVSVKAVCVRAFVRAFVRACVHACLLCNEKSLCATFDKKKKKRNKLRRIFVAYSRRGRVA